MKAVTGPATVVPNEPVSVRVPPDSTALPVKMRLFSEASVGKVVFAARTTGFAKVVVEPVVPRSLAPFSVKVPTEPKAALFVAMTSPLPLKVAPPVNVLTPPTMNEPVELDAVSVSAPSPVMMGLSVTDKAAVFVIVPPAPLS